jgi:hypothetical protein
MIEFAIISLSKTQILDSNRSPCGVRRIVSM